MTRKILVALPFVGVLAYFAVPLVGIRAEGVSVFNATAICSVVVFFTVLLLAHPKPRAPWVLIGIAMAAWVTGDLIFSAIGGDATVSVADGFYGLGYLSLISATTLLIRRRVAERDVDSVTDALLIGLAFFLFLWIGVIGPTWDDSTVSTATRVMTALYPLLDIILLFSLVRLILIPEGVGPSIVALAGALTAILAGDISFAALQQTGSYVEGPWQLNDAIWLIGYALLPVAALLAGRDPALDTREPMARPSRLSSLLAAGIALVSIPGAALLARVIDIDPTVAVFEVTGAAIVILVLTRIIRLQWSLDEAFTAVDRQQRYYRAVAEHASDSFLIVSRTGLVIDGADTVRNLIGFSLGELVGTVATDFIHPDDHSYAGALLEEALARPGVTVPGEFRVANATGKYLWLEVFCTDLSTDPAVGGIVVNAHDVTGRKEAEAELEHRALHDSVTGLANRALFRDRVERAFLRREVEGIDVAVLFCDLDGFKMVNDTIGHEAGDEVLRVAAERFSHSVRPTDTLARFGGDEFAVIIESDGDLMTEARAIADRLVEAMAEPVDVRGRPMRVTASIGIAIASDEHARTPAELMRDADTAMYSAKAGGRNRAIVYDSSMGTAVLTRVQLDNDLHQAVANNEFLLVYQPIVELATTRFTGFEALLRWDHPTRGLLTPDEFIGIAETNGTIVEIGRWVLLEACREARRWGPAADGTRPSVSVNVSGIQLAEPGFIDDVANALTATGLASASLNLEITESTLVEYTAPIAELLRSLQTMGVHIVIDDFGVGQSSLAYLRQFPVDVIKLDRSYVEGITDADYVPALVGGLLELARKLEITSLAEGIETPAQREALVREGCELGQGYLFARPVDAATAARMLSDLGYAITP